MDDLAKSFSRATVSNQSTSSTITSNQPTNRVPVDNQLTTTSRKRRLLLECCVCFNELDSEQAFNTERCNHHLCLSCLKIFIKKEVENNWKGEALSKIRCVHISCPCTYDFETILDHHLGPEEAEELRALAISKVHVLNKVTCPADNCNAIFDAEFESTKNCTFGVCLECRQGLCLACQTVWHPGEIKIHDDENEDRKILDYAYNNNWARCPKCGHIVQKSYGCDAIACICGTYFCYKCDEPCKSQIGYTCTHKPGEKVKKRLKMFEVSDKQLILKASSSRTKSGNSKRFK